MPNLYVIRHAQVNVDSRVPSSEWEISEEGISAAQGLAMSESWDGIYRIYHSPEPKAVAIAAVISEVTGIPMKVLEGLHELCVPTISPHKEFIRRVGAYLDGLPDPEFEDWDHATERIVGCVQQIVDDAAGRSVAMVSHGRILTVLFSYFLKRRLTLAEWQSIRMPDLSVVDVDTWTVERGFFAPIGESKVE